MPAPLQPVHVHVRGIGQLQEEQLVAGMSSIPAGSEPRDRMWKLSMQSRVLVVGAVQVGLEDLRMRAVVVTEGVTAVDRQADVGTP